MYKQNDTPFNIWKHDIKWLAIHDTHEFEKVPVKYIIVGKPLSVKQRTENLTQMRIVRCFFETQWSTV